MRDFIALFGVPFCVIIKLKSGEIIYDLFISGGEGYMITTNKLAKLYKAVLVCEDNLDIAKSTPLFEATDNCQHVSAAVVALEMARKDYSEAAIQYNRSHNNLPFFRRTVTYSVKLHDRVVYFYFDQHGIPTIKNP